MSISRSFCVVMATIGFGAGVTGCASTNVTKVTKAAPITYKIGKGATKYASLTQPKTGTALPKPYSPPQPISRPITRENAFDQAAVDRDLYKHQRIGKTYKIAGKSYTPQHNPDYNVVGIASWYGDKFHGKPTATGEKYNMDDFTAAHKTLPLNSMLYVTNMETGKSIMVRLNDRGPFVDKRIIDLSRASARALGIDKQGLGQVRVQYAGPADPMAAGRSVSRIAPQPVPYPEDNYVEAPMPFSPAPQIATPSLPVPSMPTPIAPQGSLPVAPEAGEGDGQVTLTIKGPIHVAGYSDAAAKPRFIRERLRTK